MSYINLIHINLDDDSFLYICHVYQGPDKQNIETNDSCLFVTPVLLLVVDMSVLNIIIKSYNDSTNFVLPIFPLNLYLTLICVFCGLRYDRG